MAGWGFMGSSMAGVGGLGGCGLKGSPHIRQSASSSINRGIDTYEWLWRKLRLSPCPPSPVEQTQKQTTPQTAGSPHLPSCPQHSAWRRETAGEEKQETA